MINEENCVCSSNNDRRVLRFCTRSFSWISLLTCRERTANFGRRVMSSDAKRSFKSKIITRERQGESTYLDCREVGRSLSNASTDASEDSPRSEDSTGPLVCSHIDGIDSFLIESEEDVRHWSVRSSPWTLRRRWSCSRDPTKVRYVHDAKAPRNSTDCAAANHSPEQSISQCSPNGDYSIGSFYRFYLEWSPWITSTEDSLGEPSTRRSIPT